MGFQRLCSHPPSALPASVLLPQVSGGLGLPALPLVTLPPLPADHPAAVPERAAGLTNGQLPSVSLGWVHHLHGELGGQA